MMKDLLRVGQKVAGDTINGISFKGEYRGFSDVTNTLMIKREQGDIIFLREEEIKNFTAYK